MNWKNKQEEERGYTDKTVNLIKKIEEINLRKDFYLDKQKVEKAIKEAYFAANLKVPKFIWKVDIFDKDFVEAVRVSDLLAARAVRASEVARAARVARVARAASTAGVTSAASAVGVARAAWVEWASGATRVVSVDFDFDYFIEEFEFLQHEKGNKKALAIYKKFLEAREAGLGYLVENNGICYLIPAPKVIWNKKFHSVKEPAIQWKNGLQVYLLEGVNFDKELWQKVVKKEITALEVLKLKNIEQRYIAFKMLGAEKLLKELKAKLLNKSKRGNELYGLTDIIPNKTIKLLKYSCPSTKRLYVKFVPFEMQYADEAQAWSHNMTMNEYNNLKIES